MKIGYITTVFPKLSETFVYQEVLALRRRGLEVVCFSIKRPSPEDLSEETRDLNRETFYLWPPSAWDCVRAYSYFLYAAPRRYLGILAFQVTHAPRTLRGVKRNLLHFLEGILLAYHCRRLGVSHLHAHFAHGPASVALVAHRLLGVPFSFTAHAVDLFKDALMLEEKVRAASFVVAISKYNRDFLHSRSEPSDWDKIQVIPCGIDVNRCPAVERRGDGNLRILSVGRLVPKKGFRVMMEALAKLKETALPFHWHLIGDGVDKEELERRAKELDLLDRVTFAGALPHPEVRRAYASADLFVLPSVIAPDGDRDGIPISLMEAMAMGVPCISTTVSGIPELIRHGVDGWLVEPGKPEALTAAIQLLWTDGALREAMARRGRQRVREHFDIERSVEKLIENFNRVNARCT